MKKVNVFIEMKTTLNYLKGDEVEVLEQKSRTGYQAGQAKMVKEIPIFDITEEEFKKRLDSAVKILAGGTKKK